MKECPRPRSPPATATDALTYCPSPDPSPYLAALGLLSAERNVRSRQAARSSWMQAERLQRNSSVVARFVVRGIGVQRRVLDEAARHGDILFVKAQQSLTCKAGPLRSLLLWMACAVAAWPNAQLVGKGDDDLWVHVPDVTAMLHAALAASRPRQRVWWGMFETFHWHDGWHRPLAFDWGFGWNRRAREHCSRRAVPPHLHVARNVSYGRLRLLLAAAATPQSEVAPTEAHGAATPAASAGPLAGPAERATAAVIGPFCFAKGPLHFLSAALVPPVLAHDWLSAEAERSTEERGRSESSGGKGGAGVRAARREETWPWEDVFLGLAVAHTAADLLVVHAGREVFALGSASSLHKHSLAIAPSTAVWHDTNRFEHGLSKDARRIGAAERHSRRRHCTLRPADVPMAPCHRYVACSGGTWRRCALQWRRDAECPTALQSVSIFRADDDARRKN